MAESTPRLRELWSAYECAAAQMVVIPFGPDRIRVAPPTAEAWKACAAVLARHGYVIRTSDTDSYNCRTITGGSEKSLHSYGIALDINWQTNPYIDHAGERSVRFSDKATQDARALDVKHALADTDMTKAMVDDVLAIRTQAGKQVFEWGGNWITVKDCMHFELDLGPADLEPGIDWSSVNGTATPPTIAQGRRYRVVARDGLRLREGPGTNFPSRRTIPAGAEVNVLSVDGDWALVDLHSDGLADGHMHMGYLQPL